MAVSLAFYGGWNWSGARWEAKYAALVTDMAVNIQESEENVRRVVTDRYAARLAEETAIRHSAETIAAEQAAATKSMSITLLNVRARYDEALKTPACREWAAQPIGCEIDEMESETRPSGLDQ